MKLNYTSSDGRLNVEVEGDQKEVFKELGSFQEVFENLECGKCQGSNVKFVVRTVADQKGKPYDYYELRCQNKKCNARFEYGQGQDGNLFPKKKNAEGEWRPDNGWIRWNAATEKEE